MSALLLLALACTAEPTETVDVGSGPDTLDPPIGLDEIDFPAAYAEMLGLAATIDLQSGWAGHVAALGEAEAGCPDFYVGDPDVDADNGIDDEDAGGLSWLDTCKTSQNKTFSGWAWWENSATQELDAITGNRRLIADGILAQGNTIEHEFDGEGSDTVNLYTDGEPAETWRWTYSSTLNATVTGALALGGGDLPGGYRTDTELYVTGGDADTIDLKSEVFLFEERIAGRFDSFAMDIYMVGDAGAGPDDCTLEPNGWIGLRDENAYWYDVVFLPATDSDGTDSGYDNDPYSQCDGCGTLYVRGTAQPDPVCVDFSVLWSKLGPPSVEDYAFTLREL